MSAFAPFDFLDDLRTTAPIQRRTVDDQPTHLRAISSASPAQPRGPAPAGVVVQRKETRPPDPVVDGAADGLLADAFTPSALNLSIVALASAKTDAQHALERWRAGQASTTATTQRLIELMRGLRPALGTLRAAMTSAADHQALGRQHPEVFDALTNIARAGLAIKEEAAQLPPRGGPPRGHDLSDGLRIVTAIDVLAADASGLGWTAPTSVAEANVARFAFEACPTGARDERPDHCNLPDSERVRLQGQVDRGLDSALTSFKAACEPRRADLDKMIASGHAAQAAIAGDFGKLVSMVITAGTGGAGPVAAWAIDLAVSSASAGLTAGATAQPVAGARTGTMLDALLDAMAQRLAVVKASVQALDDTHLRLLLASLSTIDKDTFAPRLNALVDRFLAQIDPLGRGLSFADNAALATPPSSDYRYAAVRIRAGQHTRMAQVAHEQHVTPGRPQPHHRYQFLRWIDRDLQPAAQPTVTIDVTQLIDPPLTVALEIAIP